MKDADLFFGLQLITKGSLIPFLSFLESFQEIKKIYKFELSLGRIKKNIERGMVWGSGTFGLAVRHLVSKTKENNTKCNWGTNGFSGGIGNGGFGICGFSGSQRSCSDPQGTHRSACIAGNTSDWNHTGHYDAFCAGCRWERAQKGIGSEGFVGKSLIATDVPEVIGKLFSNKKDQTCSKTRKEVNAYYGKRRESTTDGGTSKRSSFSSVQNLGKTCSKQETNSNHQRNSNVQLAQTSLWTEEDQPKFNKRISLWS